MQSFPNRQIESLRKLHADGKICLFVGAGVSKSCGLPNWEQLAERILEETWPDRGGIADVLRSSERRARSKYSPIQAMRMARQELDERFNSIVFKCLYRHAPIVSPTVEALTTFVNVTRVLCSNYDDVLEEAYRTRGIKCRSLKPDDSLPLNDNEVFVLHPHGFLPRNVPLLDDPIIVSEDDYHDLYARPYSWANMIQLNLLLSFNILFVGCSLTDPNLRRLLDLSRKICPNQHYALMLNPDFKLSSDANRPRWWAEMLSHTKHIETQDLSARGVQPIWYEDHDSQIPELLKRISEA
jgi:SIR2-like domain